MESTPKWEASQLFEEDRLLRVRLVGASVTKTATLLAVSRAAVSRGKTPATNDGTPSSAKRNGDRKPKQSERDRRTLKTIVSKNKTTAAKVTPGLFVLKTMFPQEAYDESFTNPTSTVEQQLLNL